MYRLPDEMQMAIDNEVRRYNAVSIDHRTTATIRTVNCRAHNERNSK